MKIKAGMTSRHARFLLGLRDLSPFSGRADSRVCMKFIG
jgi:hypothetical protein|tara:strand:+ start:657 stop:773 length:117 start_codon:yes stop_codon:yes gene_type:complete